jgi:ABC-type amino acid transport substrate-binding protein
MPMPSFPPTRRLGAVLAATGLAAILEATLFPNPRQAAASAATPLLCLVCGEGGGTDVFLNLFLFAPMAIGLRLLGWPWRRVVAVAALLSLTVEYLQYSVVVGRDPALSDLLANTIGAAAAAALAPRVTGLLAPDPPRARRLLPIAAGLFLGMLTVSAVGLQPGVLPGRLWSACTSFSPAIADWTGTLRSVVLNRDTLPCDRNLADSGAIRAALTAGRTTLRIDGLSGTPTGRRALVYAVSVPRASLLGLTQEGSAAILSVPTFSQHLRFSKLSLLLRGAFPSKAGVPFEVQAGQEGRRIWISSSHSGRRRSVEMALSPSFGWSTLTWWRLQPNAEFLTLTAVWLGVLIFPAGYWAGCVRRPVRGLGGVAATLVAGLGVLPALTGYPPVHWSEWLGGSLGAALGWALRWLAAYLQSRCGSPSTGAYSSS